MNRELIEDKLDELIEIAEKEDDNYILVVLLGLRGAILSGDEAILAKGVHDIIQNELLPKLLGEKDDVIKNIFNFNKN